MADIIAAGDRWEIRLAGHKVGEVAAQKVKETAMHAPASRHSPERWDVMIAGEKVGEIIRKPEGFMAGHLEWMKKHGEWDMKKGRQFSSIPEAAEFVLLKCGAAGGAGERSLVDIRKPHQRRSQPWPVKILLTAVIGGTLSLCTFWALVSVFRLKFEPLYVITVPGWTIPVGTYLCLDEHNGWKMPVIRGLILGLVASVLILAAFAAIPLLGLMLLDSIIG